MILLIVWAIGFFGYNSSNIIHFLLLIAIITFLIRIII
ncbi:MAG: lmo0937 family membrane protein [Fluviicola sp.]